MITCPTTPFEEFIHILRTLITKIVHFFLQEGSFPSCFKAAYVSPLLKNPALTKTLKNYWPVSNINFSFKIIEKAVARQRDDFIAQEGTWNVNPSTYRCFHSTALLKIQNDIADSVDHGEPVVLLLLDLSVAFYTIDHETLFGRLMDRFGTDATVLVWIQSYLHYRKQKINIGDHFSETFALPYGVPQGSVLDLLLFILYTTPLSKVVSQFNVTHHLYADDTQIYLGMALETLILVWLSSFTNIKNIHVNHTDFFKEWHNND